MPSQQAVDDRVIDAPPTELEGAAVDEMDRSVACQRAVLISMVHTLSIRRMMAGSRILLTAAGGIISARNGAVGWPCVETWLFARAEQFKTVVPNLRISPASTAHLRLLVAIT